MAAGAALAAKRGKRSKSSLKGASRQMAKLDERKGATTDGKDEAQGEADTQKQEKVELEFRRLDSCTSRKVTLKPRNLPTKKEHGTR